MKKRYFTLLALLLSAGLAAPACGGDDDDDNQTQDDDDDNQQGAGGGGNQQGAGGGGNQQGSGGGGNQQGSGGGGNQQGNAGSGGGGPGKALADVLELTGGDVDNDESLELFPFGAAIARDGSVFVSTLGNNDDIRSRIYKFEPGASSAPKLYFESNAQADNAVYGLAISDDNKLYACIAPHLLAVGSALPSTIYRFDSLDVAGQANAGFQSRVLNTNVEVDAEAGQAQSNGVNIVLDQCTNITFDNSNNLYVADAFGTSNAIFRLNMDAFDSNPAPDVDDDNVTVTNYQALLTTAWLIDNVNVGGGNGTEFGVSGIAVSGGSLFFVRQDDTNTLFSVGLSGDFPDSNVADDGTDILQAINEPSFIAASGNDFFVASLVDDKVLRLTNNNGDKQATTLIDANTVNDVNSFVNPSAIAIQGNQGLVVASQVETLLVGNVANDVFRLYSFNVPSQ